MKYLNWTSEQIQFLKNNINNYSRNDIAKILNRTPKAISDKTHILGLKKDKVYKVQYNRSFFSNINLTTCYWAGFIAADGYINEDNSFIAIHLKNSDIDHLNLFKETIEYDGELKSLHRTDSRFKTTGYTMCSLTLCGAQQLINDLKNNFNLKSHKAKNSSIPQLKNTKHIAAFINGFIDGDGSISIKKNAKKFPLRLSIIGTHTNLTFIKKFFESLIGEPLANLHNDGNMLKLEVGGKKGNQILVLLYKLATPKLHRKWNKIIEFQYV